MTKTPQANHPIESSVWIAGGWGKAWDVSHGNLRLSLIQGGSDKERGITILVKKSGRYKYIFFCNGSNDLLMLYYFQDTVLSQQTIYLP